MGFWPCVEESSTLRRKIRKESGIKPLLFSSLFSSFPPCVWPSPPIFSMEGVPETQASLIVLRVIAMRIAIE